MKKITFVIISLLVAVVTSQAQDCESMLEDANNYYSKGEYAKAAKMYKMIQEDCDSNYGGATAKLKDCNHKLKEDADFKKCTTIAACDAYLQNYPNGRYVAKVKQKRSGFVKAQMMAEEDAMYNNCTTEADCEEYLGTYPEGRYVTQVSAKLEQLVEERLEDEAYADCTTEPACDYYLEYYPNGRYYSRVLAKKQTFVAERQRREREAAKTAYMKIQEVEFANVSANGDIINYYGSTLYSSEIKYLMPRITYNGLLDEIKFVTLYYKIIKPDGTLMSRSYSPSGYTYSNSFKVQTGSYNSYEFSSWGNGTNGYFVSGIYKFELWYENNRIYQTTFVVKDKENALSRGNWRTALRKCRDYVMKTYDNSSYKGQLYDGKRSGLGMYSWNDGDYYIGGWKSGSRDGKGIYIIGGSGHVNYCPDCVYYVGGWSNGDKYGTGTCYDKFGNLIYDGSFANNKPTGTYPMTGYDNYKFECIEYSGDFAGCYYVGETYKGSPHGKGVFIWSGGNMWYGQWKEGVRDGYGIYMPYQGSVSTGTWKGDTKQ